MTTTEQTRGRSRRLRVVEILGWVGLVASILLAVAILWGHGVLEGRVNDTFDRVNQRLDQGTVVVNVASGRLQERIADIDALVTDASTLAGNVTVPPALADRVATIADRYAEIRDDYVAVRAQIGSALDTLEQVGRFLPGVEVPSGPKDALAALDERVTAFDATLTQVRTDARATVDRVLAVTTTLRSAVEAVQGVTTRIESGIAEVGDRVDRANGTITGYLWVGTGVLLLLVAYVGFLNVLVIRLARR